MAKIEMQPELLWDSALCSVKPEIVLAFDP